MQEVCTCRRACSLWTGTADRHPHMDIDEESRVSFYHHVRLDCHNYPISNDAGLVDEEEVTMMG